MISTRVSGTKPSSLALEELGPRFVKLEQIRSTRGDLLSPRYRAELAKLQDAAPGVSAAVVQRIIEDELGPEAFAWLDLDPLASASIGQAHAERLHYGRIGVPASGTIDLGARR